VHIYADSVVEGIQLEASGNGRIIGDKMLQEMQDFKPLIPGKTDQGYGMAYMSTANNLLKEICQYLADQSR
jgi:hypothetical protein